MSTGRHNLRRLIHYVTVVSCIPAPSEHNLIIMLRLCQIAQGIHWLEIPRFGRECERLLKPQGILVRTHKTRHKYRKKKMKKNGLFF